MFTKHRKSVDYILLAMASLDEGDMEGAAEFLQEAQEEPDLDEALEEMNEANEEAFGEEFEGNGEEEDLALSNVSPRSRRAALRKALAEALEDGGEEDDIEEEVEEEVEEDDEEKAVVMARLARARRNLRSVRSTA